MQFHEKVEIHGHLMDTGILARILDDVLGYGGDYEIESIDLGMTHDDESHAMIIVGADSREHLTRILMRIKAYGVNSVEPGTAVVRAADRDGIFPADFYSTTNLETVVRLGGQWVPVEHPEMDCGLVVSEGRVRTIPVSDVRAGDMIVCGVSGVKAVLPVTDHSTRIHGTFQSMSSSTALLAPQRQALLVRTIARQIRELKAEGFGVLWVAGPSVVQTGATSAMVTLIEAGYVDVLFSGNAFAAIDIEAALYGAAFGNEPSRGKGAERGHEQYIRAINTIRRAGSIAAAVDNGILTSGIMHAIVKADKKFVLVGSVRDDGPLPDVHTDVLVGQRAMRDALRGIGFAMMVASMLHSVATGNILPASIPVACVDIDPSSVTRIADRGFTHAVGVVTDAGLFLEQLAQELVADYRPDTTR
ncbi:TIGR00300 family protein [Candidatus Protofrankia californiensis]|uniref:ornithine cyclodeaminase family domain n=1 Tax=Candidatus Protofrankia californiensis TaxID=1839754 RepID=UPI0010415703|nr:TIGR00300 family protein [Candidatus Protofrankia californiensis]